jgi:hypothetical protein
MVKQASLFSQMLSMVDRHAFEREVRRLGAERHAKGFSCWAQFVAMMFCQLAQAKSIREIIDGLADIHLLDPDVDRSMAEYEECRLEWSWISIGTSGGGGRNSESVQAS